MAQPTYVKVAGPIEINCSDDWNKCQKEQACSKIRRMNTRAKNAGPRGLANISKTNRSRYNDNRVAGDDYAAAYEGTNCAAECMRPGGPPRDQADHIHEIQFNGAPAGPFMWLDAAVNGSIGTQLNKIHARGPKGPRGGKGESLGTITHLTGVTAANCEPAC